VTFAQRTTMEFYFALPEPRMGVARACVPRP
jgi:hypothetical protein